MTWLLRLYPRRWRRRYGGEVAAMLAGRSFSLAVAVDLVAGAIDVWLHPSATLAAATAASPQEERTMLSRIARLECAALMGSDVTKADQRKASWITVGLTLVLTLIWMYAHIRIGDNPYVDSSSNGFNYIVSKFREQPIAAHIELQKGERSELAELAANLL